MTRFRHRVLAPLLAWTFAAQATPLSAQAGEALPRPSEPAPIESEANDPQRGPWATTIEARLAELATQEPRPPVRHPSVRLPEDRLRRLAESLSDAELGISVRDLRTGDELFSWHGEATLNPASNQKLVTASAAIELLGADFRFETTVRRHGDTLYLVGGGDPSLQTEDLAALVARLPAAALRGVERIAYDDSMFSPERFGPGYASDGPGYSYMAPSGALSLQFNTIEIAVRPLAGGRTQVAVSPACAHVDVHNTARTRGRRHATSVRTTAAGERTRVDVAGSVAAQEGTFRIRRRITDPGAFTASVFARMIAARHGGPELPLARATAPREAELVATHRSAPLSEVLVSGLKYSNNFTMEQVLRTLGHLASEAPGDWHNGTEIVRRFWAALGEDVDAVWFENGSGLSAHGRVSARALTRLVQRWVAPTGEPRPIVEALPIAGREGTLHDRLQRTRGRVRAKTGTLTGATALTGVISDAHGSPTLGFSILVNGPVSPHRARSAQDRLVRVLLEAPLG